MFFHCNILKDWKEERISAIWGVKIVNVMVFLFYMLKGLNNESICFCIKQKAFEHNFYH